MFTLIQTFPEYKDIFCMFLFCTTCMMGQNLIWDVNQKTNSIFFWYFFFFKPSVSLLKAKTSETWKFEFLIAKKNKKESIHYKKWENMLL